MKRNTIKYLIDISMFVNFSSLTIIGLLLGFVIPKGRDADKFFMGLHRHEWGDIHLYLSLLFLALIALHVSYNWEWVKANTKKIFGEDNLQKVLIGLSSAWLLVLVIGWIAVKLS